MILFQYSVFFLHFFLGKIGVSLMWETKGMTTVGNNKKCGKMCAELPRGREKWKGMITDPGWRVGKFVSLQALGLKASSFKASKLLQQPLRLLQLLREIRVQLCHHVLSGKDKSENHHTSASATGAQGSSSMREIAEAAARSQRQHQVLE